VLTDDETIALVRRAQAGDARALEPLARRSLRAAYAVALAVVGRPSDAEDVAQEALVAALEQIETCRDPSKYAAWLTQIARNRARHALERRRFRDPVEQAAGDETSVDPPEHVLARGPLLAALQGLGEVPREVVLLHDLEGWTHPEIAAALGISETNSRQHLFQARRVLRERLADPQAAGKAGVTHGR
jgi:RNA polymerase sigma-70 factor (ECF subfamily)